MQKQNIYQSSDVPKHLQWPNIKSYIASSKAMDSYFFIQSKQNTQKAHKELTPKNAKNPLTR